MLFWIILFFSTLKQASLLMVMAKDIPVDTRKATWIRKVLNSFLRKKFLK